ncbi:MAG: hypothetical protein H0T89_05005 [Deltaproteobacteria bacterium]|nr:hypothetical protein [Deltaproteobacteria bacterium]MDQ3300153.1 hypothetical protein [Myxococcota bacterium]
MNQIKLLGVSMLLALSLGACGDAADDIAKLSKEACACKDKACGDAVNKKLDAAIEKLSSEADLKKAAGPLGEAGMCLGKLGL